jgi:hypothetical protein
MNAKPKTFACLKKPDSTITDKLRILRHPVLNISEHVNVSCNPSESPYQLMEA